MKRLLVVLLFLFFYKSSLGQLSISTNFESGSARVLAIDQETQTIRITPAGNPKRGMPNWWFFRIDGINIHKPVMIEITASEELVQTSLGKIKKINPDWSWPDQADYSIDGKTWKQTDFGIKQNGRSLYTVNSASKTLWLSWSPPFTPTDAAELIGNITKGHAFAHEFSLTQSLEGRTVPALKLSEGKKSAEERPAIWVQARQHAWEVGGSWIAAGLANWLISDDVRAVWLRHNTEIYIIPIMDVDHVATGDGGKNGLPHDHNRDWNENPHWPEVASAQKYIQALTKENRMNIFLDLHNPAPGNKQQTMYVLHESYIKKEAFPRQQRFVQLMIEQFGELKQNLNGPRPTDTTSEERVSEVWVLDHANPNTIAFCVETPWNSSKSTIDGYSIVGQNLGKVIQKLLASEY